MKVQELIMILEKCDPNADVLTKPIFSKIHQSVPLTKFAEVKDGVILISEF